MQFKEIVWEVGFSNISHLSYFFKKQTGVTLSEYRKFFIKIQE